MTCLLSGSVDRDQLFRPEQLDLGFGCWFRHVVCLNIQKIYGSCRLKTKHSSGCSICTFTKNTSTLKRLAKIAADDILIFYFYLSKKIGLGLSCESCRRFT